MKNSMVMLTLLVLDQKYSLWANLVQKNLIVSLSLNLVPRCLQYVEFEGGVHTLDSKYPFWINLFQNIQNY